MRFRLVALIALMLTGVVGCTSSGSNGPSGTLSTSAPTSVSTAVTSPISAPTPSPSVATTGPNVRPGEKPPVLPALGTKNLPAGAITFAQYWFQAIDWGYATTDSALARSLYAASCRGCANFANNIFDATARAGEHFVGGRIAATRTSITKNDHHNGASYVIDVTISQGAARVLDKGGHVVERIPAVSGDVFRTWLRRTPSGWTVADWKRAVK